MHSVKAMETYCICFKKNTANKSLSVRKTKQNRLMILSNCAVFGTKKLDFISKYRTFKWLV